MIETHQRDEQRAQSWPAVGIFWILTFAVFYIAQSVLVPIIAAILIALVFSPLRRGLNRIGIPSAPAAALILICVLGTLAALLTGVSASIQERLVSLDTLIPDALSRLEVITGMVEPVLDAGEQIDDLGAPAENVQQVVVRQPGIIALVATTTPIIVGQVIFAFTLAIFLISSGDMFYEKLVQIMPTIHDKAKAVAITRAIETQLSCYLMTITIINALLGVVVGFTMWMFGMPDPILFGLLAFALNYIPYIGGLMGVALTFLVGLLTFDTLLGAATPALAYWVLTAMEGQFLTPFLVGRRLKLNAVIVFLAVAIGAWMWSVMGMFLSTPILIAIKAFSDRIPALQGLGKFLGEKEDIGASDGRLLQRFFPYRENLTE